VTDLTTLTDGSRLGCGANGIRGGMAEWQTLGWTQSPHGLQPGSVRCRVQSWPESWKPWPDERGSGQEAHHDTKEGVTRHH